MWDYLVLIGDLHLRATAPVSRIDDFVEAQAQKVRAIVNIVKAREAIAVFTGDLFDRPDPPYALVNRYVPILNELESCTKYVVPGNHDVYGGSLATLGRSALGNLVAHRSINLLGPEPMRFRGPRGPVALFGTSYMHPNCPSPDPDCSLNVLVAHEMIVENQLYREQEDFTLVDQILLDRPGWDMIVCGHYHYRFLRESGTTRIVNPGAVVRVKASVGDLALEPAVYGWNLNTNELELIPLPHLPSKQVFQPVIVDAGKSQEPEVLQALMAQLQTRNDQRLSLSEVAHRVMAERETEEPVRARVLDALADAEAGYGAGRKA